MKGGGPWEGGATRCFSLTLVRWVIFCSFARARCVHRTQKLIVTVHRMEASARSRSLFVPSFLCVGISDAKSCNTQADSAGLGALSTTAVMREKNVRPPLTQARASFCSLALCCPVH